MSEEVRARQREAIELNYQIHQVQRYMDSSNRIVQAAKTALDIPQEDVDGFVAQCAHIMASHPNYARVHRAAVAFARFKAELEGAPE